jgi:hypothetical protein
MTSLPRFVLGHNALIGVDHVSRVGKGIVTSLGDQGMGVLERALELGIGAMVVDNHPVSLQAVKFLEERRSRMTILPMVPYAQGVVDETSRSGLFGTAASLAKAGIATTLRHPLRTMSLLAQAGPTGPGWMAGLAGMLEPFKRLNPPVVFLHNAVTDLLVGWGAWKSLRAFAKAIQAMDIEPGFVTLNPGWIPRIREEVGGSPWFMAAVNSRGIQMSPDRTTVEKILQDSDLKVLGMSILGGGLLPAAEEIPRAFSFPAVKSIVVGTRRPEHLSELVAIARHGSDATV